MNSFRPRTPPEDLWLEFDFTKLSLPELNRVYKEIKNSEMDHVLDDLRRCYMEKKQSSSSQNMIDLPPIKTPEHNRKPKIMKKPKKLKSIPVPRQWWAFHHNN